LEYFNVNRKTSLLLILLIIVLGMAWYAWKEFGRTNPDLKNTKPDYTIAATELIREYEMNDSAANSKFNGKVVEIKGNVKKVEKDDMGYYTIILGTDTILSSVRCSMDTTHQQDAAMIRAGTSVTVRGACTGFNKDEMGLGSDVILNRCAVINKK
jgi:hypothetical protein